MIDNKFNLDQNVRVVSLQWPGRVKDIWITMTGIQYNIRYIYNGEAKFAYFYEDELEEVK